MTARLRTILIAFPIVVAGVMSLGPSVSALPAQRTDEDRIGVALISEPNGWPWTMAKLFATRLPKRIRHPLSGQTAKTIRAFVLKTETPYSTKEDEPLWLCTASTGVGGSTVALIAEKASEYTYVWDSLIPPSVVSPTIRFIDFDADAVPEVVYTGQLLQSSEREWAILRWDTGRLKLMAPRLDMPSEYVFDNRVIGDSMRILDVRDHGVQRLGVWRSGDDGTSGDGEHQSYYREFIYVDSIGGYLPTAGYRP